VTVPVVGDGGIGDTTGTVPSDEEGLGSRSRGVPGLPAVKIDSEPAVASIPAVFAAVLKVPTLLPRPSKSLVHYTEGIGNIGQSREQTRTCEMCGSPKRRHRKLNYTKGDGSTGQLVVCNECASAWKTTQHEDGVWALTIDLDKI